MDRRAKWISILTATYIINNFYVPLDTIIRDKKQHYVSNEISQITQVKAEYNQSTDKTLFGKLMASQFAVAKHITYKENCTEDVTIAVKRGRGNCRIFSQATYMNMLYLNSQEGNSVQNDSIRLATGYVNDNTKESPHQWIEYYYANTWNVFEATLNYSEIDAYQKNNQGRELVNRLFKSKTAYYALSYAQITHTGELDNTINWRNSALDYRGLWFFVKEFVADFFDKT